MGRRQKEQQKRLNRQRHDSLLTLFDSPEGYEEKEVNGYWLVKSFNGNTKKWQVSIYSPEGYRNYKEYPGTLNSEQS